MTRCEHCNKPLKDLEEVHAVYGSLYCSKECAIAHIIDEVIMNAKETAIEQYEEGCEVVATKDILANELYMDKDQILEALEDITKRRCSQYRHATLILNLPTALRDTWLNVACEAQLKDVVDLIAYLEG